MSAPEISGFVNLLEIGRTPSGVTYRAYDVNRDQPVDVYVATSPESGPGIRALLTRVELVSERAGRQHIVTILAVGIVAATGQFYVVTPAVQRTMATRIAEQGPINWRRAVGEVVHLARAMQAVHSAGLLHRNIEPASVVISPAGTVQLDTVQLIDAGAGEADRWHRLTSREYRAPEVWYGDVPSVQSDIYSLAATAIARLIGREEFHFINQYVARHLELVPEPVLDTLARGLASNPRYRPASMANFASELNDAVARRARQKPPRASESLSRSRRRLFERLQEQAIRSHPDDSSRFGGGPNYFDAPAGVVERWTESVFPSSPPASAPAEEPLLLGEDHAESNSPDGDDGIAAPARVASAWLPDDAPDWQAGVTTVVNFVIGAPRPEAAAATPFEELDFAEDQDHVQLTVVCLADRAQVDQPVQPLRLPRSGDTKILRFRVTPPERGVMEIVFRIYLDAGGYLLQELRVAGIEVAAPELKTVR